MNYLSFISSFLILFFCLQLLSGIFLTVIQEQSAYTVMGNYTTAENSFFVTIIVMVVSALLAFLFQKWLKIRSK
ncbi:hypothetical protein [Bacillus sp. RAR_GA_16]|uniref:hypothetical protein n=1 Tax=Bacillus sp. RAR_GA_16 TaxID=2876774 RepID=UPI001CCABD7F|nr:hypothetical protein [Bacillus sp. RAR_GA_16]MCA0172498.1 hypothetical protein [Bacillus sp. RAR_GA_16]